MISLNSRNFDVKYYRIEEYAYLVYLLFLHYCVAYFSLELNNHILVLCDNESDVNEIDYLI